MSYRVFISHSTKDQVLIFTLAQYLASKNIEAFVAEWNPKLGTDLTQKIFPQIDQSDCVVAILTKDGNRSEWVNQEIGYAFKAQKLIISVIESGVKVSGALIGKEYVQFDKTNVNSIYNAMQTVSEYIAKMKLSKEQKQTAMIIGGLILLALLASDNKR